MTYRFTAAALFEYEESILFYLTEASSAVAEDFDREVTNALKAICELPSSGKPFAETTRERLLERFPFSIVYSVENDEVVVLP